MDTTASFGIPVKSLDASAGGTGTNGTRFALPGGKASAIAYQTVFGTAPDAISLLIQTSIDGTTWATIATLTNVSGEAGIAYSAAKWVRARINSQTNGSTVTVNLTTAAFDVTVVDPNGNPFDQDLNTTDSVEFDNLTITSIKGITYPGTVGAVTGDILHLISPTDLAFTATPTLYSITITEGSNGIIIDGGSQKILPESDLYWALGDDTHQFYLAYIEEVVASFIKSHSNTDLTLAPQGTGDLHLNPGGDLRVGNFTAITTPGFTKGILTDLDVEFDTLTAGQLIYPNGDPGISGYVITTDGFGNLSLAAAPNPFNQSLNTTNGPEFGALNMAGNIAAVPDTNLTLAGGTATTGNGPKIILATSWGFDDGLGTPASGGDIELTPGEGVNGGATGKVIVALNHNLKASLQTYANATTGLSAGALAAATNASIVITDGSGQVYRVPCII